MKILIFSSRFKPPYFPVSEAPREFCIGENCTIAIKAEKPTCPTECEMDAPFGKRYDKVCCENC